MKPEELSQELRLGRGHFLAQRRAKKCPGTGCRWVWECGQSKKVARKAME